MASSTVLAIEIVGTTLAVVHNVWYFFLWLLELFISDMHLRSYRKKFRCFFLSAWQNYAPPFIVVIHNTWTYYVSVEASGQERRAPQASI